MLMFQQFSAALADDKDDETMRESVCVKERARERETEKRQNKQINREFEMSEYIIHISYCYIGSNNIIHIVSIA